MIRLPEFVEFVAEGLLDLRFRVLGGRSKDDFEVGTGSLEGRLTGIATTVAHV